MICKDGARCDLCPRNGQPFVGPAGRPESATFVWIDEEPRQRQTKEDAILAGTSMQRLEELHQAKLAESRRAFDPAELYATFGALCAPVNPKSDTERRAALTCCRPRLLAELARRPDASGILALGKWAVFALVGSEKKVEDKYGFHAQWSLTDAQAMAAAAIAKLEKKGKR